MESIIFFEFETSYLSATENDGHKRSTKMLGNLMNALLQSSSGPQQQQGSGGGDMLSQVVGGLLGGGQQGNQQGSGGGDMLSQVVGGLLGGGQQGGGGGMLGQVVGDLLGGGQQGGGAPINQLLGGLEQIIGGTPGTGQPMNMNMNQGNSMMNASNQMMNANNPMMNASNPIMGLLQPVITHLSQTTGIPPEIATTVAGIAIHYLLSSHPSSGGNGRLDLNSMMQQISSGNVNMDTLHNSGMVKDVMQATGLSQQDAAKTLSATFSHLQGHVNPTPMRKVNKSSQEA
jgi:hypothetical protein